MFSIKLAPSSDTPIWLNTLQATAAQKIIPHKAAIAFPIFIRLSAIFSYWGGSCLYQITLFCWSWRLMWHQEKRESNTKFIFQTPFLGLHLGCQEGKSPILAFRRVNHQPLLTCFHGQQSTNHIPWKDIRDMRVFHVSLWMAKHFLSMKSWISSGCVACPMIVSKS